MSEPSPETEDAAPDQEPTESAPPKSLRYRLQEFGYRKFPKIIPDPDRHEILRASRSRDEENNAKTEPPPDEVIDLRCIWGVEIYAPSQISQLLRGFDKLGWNRDDPTGPDRNPAIWIQRYRESALGGGWYNLGPIHRPDDRRFFAYGRAAPLPPEIDYALASMYSLTSSITCIVVGFILKEEYSRRFDQALRLRRETVLERLPNGGYLLPGPDSQKAAHVRAIRAQIRTLASDWFRKHLSGLFASGAMDGEFPTCEFTTLRNATPLPNWDQQDRDTDDWLRLLDLDHDFDAWHLEGMPGLKFAWPLLRDNDNRFHAVIAAKEDAISEDDLRIYGGGSRSSYVFYVNRRINGLLSRWALIGLLAGFERHLNNIRDSAAFDPEPKDKPLAVLETLGSHIAKSVDISAASAELQHFAERRALFDHEVEKFKPCDKRLYRDEAITLSQALREQIRERSEWLQNIDRSVRDLLIQHGSILSARENIELQKSMSIQTKIMVVLTVVITVLAAVTTFATLGADKDLWPW